MTKKPIYVILILLVFALLACKDQPRQSDASTGKPAVQIRQSGDRCISYVQEVRVQHTKYFGIQFPYWYGVGQLKTESACRSGITSFDAGQGIAQFTPKTSQYVQSLMGEALDPYNPSHAIKMQAFYMHRIHAKANWTDRLWVDYQIYNGGKVALHNEYVRAGILDHDAMKEVCRRQRKQMSWGILDLCSVNYEYSKKVEQHGNTYRRGPDAMRYW